MAARKKSLMVPVTTPGKFEGQLELTQALYDLGVSEGADDEESVGEGTWYGLFLRLSSLDFDGRSIGKVRAAIMYEDSYGFVTARYFTTDNAAQKKWKAMVADMERGGEWGE
jgi:hypothetical protein